MRHIKERAMEKLQLNYDADYYYNKGVDLADGGQSEKAVYYYYRSLSLEPYNPWTMAEIGMCYYDLRMYDEAVVWFNRALCHDKNCTAAAMGEFMCCLQSGNVAGAQRFLPLCEPEEVNAYVESEEFEDISAAMKTDDGAGKPKSMFMTLERYRENELFDRAKAKVETGSLDDAAEILGQIDEKSELFAEASFLLAAIACAEKKYDKIIEIAEKMDDVCPSDVKTQALRLAAFHIKNQTEKETGELASIKKMRTGGMEECTRIMFFFDELGMNEAASVFLEQALELEPQRKSLRILSAICSHNLKRHDQCRAKMCDLARLYPEDGEISCLADMTMRLPDLKISLSADLKKSTSDYYVVKFLEEWASFETLEEVEEKYDEDDSFYDRMMAFFMSGRGEYIEKLVPIIAESKRLRPILRELMVVPDMPMPLKIECMTQLLKNERKREFAVQFGDAFVEFVRVKVPKIDKAADVYYRARSALAFAFAGLSGFEDKLIEKFFYMKNRNEKELTDGKKEKINAAWLLFLTFGSDAAFFSDMLGVSVADVMKAAPVWTDENKEEEEINND